MEFDALDSWSTAAGPVPGEYDVQAIATHEGGHWLGVSHSTVGLALPLNAETATMVPAGTSGNIDLRSLVEDDIASIIRTYARNSTPPGPQTVGGRAVIKFTLKKGATCEPATGVSVWAYETSGGLNGPNRVETFSGSQFRDPIGEPYNGSVKLNVSPGGPYTIYARTLEDNGTSSAGLYSAFRFSNTTIKSNTMEPNALTQEFDSLATVASIAVGDTVDLVTVGFLGCWIPVASSDVDIAMTASTAPATATLGDQIAVTSSFTNQGSAASESFEVGFYFSGDATINTDDAFTGFTCTIGGLGVGGSDSCDRTIPVPAVAPGTYFVGALADIHNVIPEDDESNNAFATPPQVVVSSDPLNPIVNRSFEDNGGSFHGWNIKELSRASNPQLPLTVVGPGYEYPAPSFTAGNWILDYFASQPTDGAFAAVHDFNGDDQGTLSTTFVNRRELYQDLTLPAGTTILQFDYRAAWELYRFGATQDRTFGVEIQPAGGGGVLHAETILFATAGGEPPTGTGFEEDTDNPTGVGGPYPVGIVNLSVFAGQDIRLMFVWNVPEPGTGFAYFQLDNIRMTATVPLSVSVSPANVTLGVSEQQQFTATVTGGSDPSVTWDINLAAGSIDTNGLYTAPASIDVAQTVTVTATSVEDPTQSGSATVDLAPVVVSLSPTSATLGASGTQQFTPTVSGTPNTAVTWAISPATGSIDANGLYTAPASIAVAETVTVTATSVADPNKSANATVDLITGGGGDQPPAVSITSPADSSAHASSDVPITYSASDDVALDRCEIQLDGGIAMPYPACEGTTLSYVHLVDAAKSLAMDFAENTGAAAHDRSGNGNDGSLVGGTSWNSAGRYGVGLSFDGVDDYVEIPDSSSLSIAGDMTIAAWINVTDFANYTGIVGKTIGNLPAPYDFYLWQGTGIPKFYRGNRVAVNWVDGASAPATGVWQHVAVVMNGTSVTHYLNGAPNGSGTLSTTIADAGTAVKIGSRDDLVTKMKGSLDEVVIYNRALSGGRDCCYVQGESLGRKPYPERDCLRQRRPVRLRLRQLYDQRAVINRHF